MISKLNCILLAGSLSLTSLSIEAAGFRMLQISDPGHSDLNVGVWYPSDQPESATPNTEFGLAVALNAPVGTTNGGLILLSHGFGGWYAGHADTAAALADAGFVVAAPTHTGNTWSDMSSPIEKWLLDRPRHITRTIDHVLDRSIFATHVSKEKIGLYGFSAGGYTAMGLVGAVPDLDRVRAHCEQQPQEFVCAEGMIDEMLNAGLHELPDSAWGADPRIKAAAIAAPGFGFAYGTASLANVSADIQLWSGERDENVPTSTNAASIAENLPRMPETHWVDKANHFAFMTVACREAFKKDDPKEYEVICGDAEGFDRWVFHEEMHDEMIRFFRESFD